MLYRVASRDSLLALHQTELIIAKLQRINPQDTFEIVPLKTTGDIRADDSIETLLKEGELGIFNTQLQQAVLDRKVSLATACYKDVETQHNPALQIVAIGEREDYRDVLISRNGQSIAKLPAQAVVGTSSLRRKSQLLRLRPDLEIRPLRGNLQRRLKMLADGYDAIILAAAGLIRLGLSQSVSQWFSADEIMPAPGQGALVCQCLASDHNLVKLLQKLEENSSNICLNLERMIMVNLNGGCLSPLGVLVEQQNYGYSIKATLCSLDGTERISHTKALSISTENHSELTKIAAEFCAELRQKDTTKLIDSMRL